MNPHFRMGTLFRELIKKSQTGFPCEKMVEKIGGVFFTLEVILEVTAICFYFSLHCPILVVILEIKCERAVMRNAKHCNVDLDSVKVYVNTTIIFSIFSWPGRSPGRAIVLPPASALSKC